MKGVERLFDILPWHAEHYNPKPDVLAYKESGRWITYSIKEYRTMVDYASYALLEMGIGKDDKIGTIMPGRPEWNIIDMAILQIGAVHVPVYPTIKESDYRYILQHAEVKLLFIPGMDIYRKIEHIIPDLPSLKGIITIKEIEGLILYNEFIEKGKKAQANEKELLSVGTSGQKLPEIVEEVTENRLDKIKKTIRTHDLASIIYTSGTTGNQKGVMLTHHNILSNVLAVEYILPVGEEGKALSYLPLCHIYERMLNYVFQYAGLSIYYAESIAMIAENIREIKPDVVTTVPRLLEKIYDRIIQTGRKLTGFKKYIFFWAVNLSTHFKEDGKNSAFYKLKLSIFDKLVFSKWRSALGGSIKVVVSGGAALQPRLAHTFWAAGIPVLEGYGLTETSPVIAVNEFAPVGLKFGTVGKPIKNTRVMIAADGEILMKGPGLMLGYYKEPELTKAVIDDDGWFHSGDIGVLLPEGHLKITGRKKEIFKTSLGKYISPELLENKFKESPFIDTLIVLGENEKFAAALVVPDFAFLNSWCRIKEVPYTSNKEMINNAKIKKRYELEINKYNHCFGSTEQIKRFQLMGEEFTIESGELTPSLKLRRNFITQKYADVIRKLFV